MKIVIPKGSYHNYCRNSNNTKSLPHTMQLRTIRNYRACKQAKQIQHFNDFQTYLLHIQERNTHPNKGYSSRGSSVTREAKTSRPQTHQFVRKKSIDKQKQTSQPIKPFFPFFKCKIESCSVPSSDCNFKLNDRKFKLKYRIIEQNMGKGLQKFGL